MHQYSTLKRALLCLSFIFSLAACGGSSSDGTPSTSGNVSNLTFTGAVAGSITSEGSCTKSSIGLNAIWTQPINGKLYLFQITPTHYNGAGTYTTDTTAGSPSVSITDQSIGGTTTWLSQHSSQPGTIIVNANQTSGTVDDIMTGDDAGKTTVHVTGTWTCAATNY